MIGVEELKGRREMTEMSANQKEAQSPQLAVARWDSECTICYVVPDPRIAEYRKDYQACNPHVTATGCERIQVPYAYTELDRRCDGVLPCDGMFWFITEARRDEILAAIAATEAAKVAKAQARTAQTQAKTEAAFAEARVTGKPVALATWMEDCDGSVKECSTDAVTKWAMPNGATKIGRAHV